MTKTEWGAEWDLQAARRDMLRLFVSKMHPDDARQLLRVLLDVERRALAFLGDRPQPVVVSAVYIRDWWHIAVGYTHAVQPHNKTS